MILVVIAVIAGLATTTPLLHGQSTPPQQTPLPAWATIAGSPSLATANTWILPELSGPGEFDVFERNFVSLFGYVYTNREHNVTFHCHPESGTVARKRGPLPPTSSGPATEYGFDCGLDKAFHIDSSTDINGATDSVIITGLDSSGSSVVKKLPWNGTNEPVFSNTTTIMSTTGPIYVRSGIVDHFLYAFDLKTSSFHRYTDADEDGFYESRDTSFSLSVTEANPHYYYIAGFDSFHPGLFVRSRPARREPLILGEFCVDRPILDVHQGGDPGEGSSSRSRNAEEATPERRRRQMTQRSAARPGRVARDHE